MEGEKFPSSTRRRSKRSWERWYSKESITKQTEPTPWVSSLTYPKKANGKLRICLVPKDLNKAIIICENHKASNPQGDSPCSHRSHKSFQGGWQQGLLWDASDRGSFTPHYIQHPPWKVQIFTCPRWTQNEPRYLSDEDGWHCSPVPGSTGHTWWCVHLWKGWQRLWCQHHKPVQCGPERRTCFSTVQSVPSNRLSDILWRHVLSQRILSRSGKDPRHFRDDTPQMKQELQSFLGAVNYLQTFVPHLSHHTDPLRALLKKENSFARDENSNTSFQKIKSLLEKALLKPLRYYDRSKLVTLQCDASLKGLGACIIQDSQPIAFAEEVPHRHAETCYANIERELLAIMYGCEKFHTYLYGSTFIVETDHKPLEMISLKNLIAAPARLQRMLLRLQQYDMVITYRPGKEMLLADALSQLPSRTNTEIWLNLRVDAISMSAFTRGHLMKVRAETQRDPILLTVHRLTLNGWPDRCGCVPRVARNYWDFHDRTFHQGWTAPERWMSGHSTILQRLYYGWSSQKPCRNQQGIVPGQNMCLLAWDGSRCDGLHQEMPDMHQVQ